MNVTKTAQEIKALLVKMAANDKLPMDMTQLSTEGIEEILEKNSKKTKYEKAGELLCASSDEELEMMVKAIEDAEDENEIIDYIDGVSVWEKLEFSFRVRDFLEYIN